MVVVLGVGFAIVGLHLTPTVQLAGTHGLRDETLDFHGTLWLQAKLSRVTTGVKSFPKPFDPFFRKNGVTVLPIKVTGTRDQPSFGLDFGHKRMRTGASKGTRLWVTRKQEATGAAASLLCVAKRSAYSRTRIFFSARMSSGWSATRSH